MPEETKQGHLETWAIVEVMGHQTYAGFVTTEAFGGAVMFRVEVPETPDGEPQTLTYSNYIAGAAQPAGAVVQQSGTPAFTKLIGAGSIYAITPCTEEAARKAATAGQSRPFRLVSLPEVPQIQAPPDHEDDEGDPDRDEDDVLMPGGFF